MAKKQKTSTANRGFSQRANLIGQIDYSTLKLPSFEQTLELMIASTAVGEIARREALEKMLSEWFSERG